MLKNTNGTKPIIIRDISYRTTRNHKQSNSKARMIKSLRYVGILKAIAKRGNTSSKMEKGGEKITTLQYVAHNRHYSKTKSSDAQTDITPFRDTQTQLFTTLIASIEHSNSLPVIVR